MDQHKSIQHDFGANPSCCGIDGPTRFQSQVAIRLLIAKEDAAWILGKRGLARITGCTKVDPLVNVYSELLNMAIKCHRNSMK